MFELFSMHDSTPENAAVFVFLRLPSCLFSHYFKDLARVNGDYDPIDPKFNKLNSSCFPLFSTPNGESWVAYAAAGHQSAVKRKESKSNDVYVTLVLIRIPHCDTDFLISLNSTKIADDKSFDKPGHIFSESEDEAVMELIAKNLKFNDWSLVGA